MRGLVTGGAGYIGSHAARTLQRRGHEVIPYDNLSTGHAQLARGLELVVGDVGDLPKLKPALERVDAVMHFAAHAYVGEPVTDPRKYFHNKVQAGLTLLNKLARISALGVAYVFLVDIYAEVIGTEKVLAVRSRAAAHIEYPTNLAQVIVSQRWCQLRFGKRCLPQPVD